jgi:hypothetical protein
MFLVSVRGALGAPPEARDVTLALVPSLSNLDFFLFSKQRQYINYQLANHITIHFHFLNDNGCVILSTTNKAKQSKAKQSKAAKAKQLEKSKPWRSCSSASPASWSA